MSTTSAAVLLVPARETGSVIEDLISSSNPRGEASFLDLAGGASEAEATASELTEVEDAALAVPAMGRPVAVVGRGPAGECVRGVDDEGPGVEGFELFSLSLPLVRRDCL